MPTDKQLVALKQKHEIAYFRRKYGIPAATLRAVMAEIKSRSRKKIMQALIEKGLIESVSS